MGVFSDLCHRCKHPLLSIAATNQINRWMTRGVAITPDGTIHKGDYDGYGRLYPEDEDYDAEREPVVNGENTVWHMACWRAAGEPKEFRGASSPAEDQGWFFDEGAHDMPEPGDNRTPEEHIADIAKMTLERLDGMGSELTNLQLQMRMLADWAANHPELVTEAIILKRTEAGLNALRTISYQIIGMTS